MFGRRLTLMKLFGIELRLDLSWIITFVLMVWSLSRGLFPFYQPELPQTVYWSMGVITALGFFVSLVFHELCHSLVARHYGIPIRSITLFLFGGAAEIEGEPPSAKAEALMASAGPAASLAIGAVLGQAAGYGRMLGWPAPMIGVLSYLAWINIVVAVFNLLPAFPLDGGRLLRAALWGWRRDIRWATRIASAAGVSFGLLLIMLGLLRIFQSDIIGGLWYFMVGTFLRGAAAQSYEQLLIRRVFEGHTVRQFMRVDPVMVPSGCSVRALIEDYFYRHHFKRFPVVERGKLLGCVSLAQVREVPSSDWDRLTVDSLVKPCGPEDTVSAETALLHALSLMSRSKSSTLLVMQSKHVVGTLALRDIMGFLAIKLELGDLDSPDRQTQLHDEPTRPPPERRLLESHSHA